MKQMKNKIHRKDQRNVLTRIRIVIKRRGPDQTTEMKRPWGSKWFWLEKLFQFCPKKVFILSARNTPETASNQAEQPNR